MLTQKILEVVSFLFQFAFTKLIEKMYRNTLSKKEQEAAASKLDLFKSYFRYAEWEYGDLIIRYHGYAAIFGRGGGLRDIAVSFIKLEIKVFYWLYKTLIFLKALSFTHFCFI